MPVPHGLTAELGHKELTLRTVSPAELRDRWLQIFGQQPPRLQRDMLIRAILWRLQVIDHSGISQAAADKLAQAAAASTSNRSACETHASRQAIKRYVRVWQGVTHTVDEVADGFIWQGQQHRSLSAVAKAITGTHWNGPLFFGLRDRNAWASNRGKRAVPARVAQTHETKVASHG